MFFFKTNIFSLFHINANYAEICRVEAEADFYFKWKHFALIGHMCNKYRSVNFPEIFTRLLWNNKTSNSAEQSKTFFRIKIPRIT